MPIETISVVAQASGPTWVDAPLSSGATESDAARMADLLADQPIEPAPFDPALSVSPASSAGGRSIGYSILRSLDSAGHAYKARSEAIDLALEPGAPVGTVELLRLQRNLLESSLQVEVVSKVVSKATQDIDQLTKLQ